jgi:hypothetical protein
MTESLIITIVVWDLILLSGIILYLIKINN